MSVFFCCFIFTVSKHLFISRKSVKSGQPEHPIPEQNEHMIPEITEPLKPERKHHNINAKRLYYLIKKQTAHFKPE